MKVKELIEELNKYDPEAFVNLSTGSGISILKNVSAMFWSGFDGDGGIAPSLSDGKGAKLTPAGAMCRDLRVKYKKTMRDMSAYMDVPPYYLSSIELGIVPLRKEDAQLMINFMRDECSVEPKEYTDFHELVIDQAKDF